MWLYPTKMKCCDKLIHSTVHFNWNRFVLCIKAQMFLLVGQVSQWITLRFDLWPLPPHFRVFCLCVSRNVVATKWDQYRTPPEIQWGQQNLPSCTSCTWLLSILFHRTDSPATSIPPGCFLNSFMVQNSTWALTGSDGTASSPRLHVRSSFLKRANLNRSGTGTFTPYCRVSDWFMRYNSSFSPSHKV